MPGEDLHLSGCVRFGGAPGRPARRPTVREPRPPDNKGPSPFPPGFVSAGTRSMHAAFGGPSNGMLCACIARRRESVLPRRSRRPRFRGSLCVTSASLLRAASLSQPPPSPRYWNILFLTGCPVRNSCDML